MESAARRLDERLAALPISHCGQRKRSPTPIEAEALAKYWGTGRTISSMAKAFGISENTLRRWAREAGLTG